MKISKPQITTLQEYCLALLGAAHDITGEDEAKQQHYLKRAQLFGKTLERLAPTLQELRVEIRFRVRYGDSEEKTIVVGPAGDLTFRKHPKPAEHHYAAFPLYGVEHQHEYALVSNVVGVFRRCRLCGDFPPPESATHTKPDKQLEGTPEKDTATTQLNLPVTDRHVQNN